MLFRNCINSNVVVVIVIYIAVDDPAGNVPLAQLPPIRGVATRRRGRGRGRGRGGGYSRGGRRGRGGGRSGATRSHATSSSGHRSGGRIRLTSVSEFEQAFGTTPVIPTMPPPPRRSNRLEIAPATDENDVTDHGIQLPPPRTTNDNLMLGDEVNTLIDAGMGGNVSGSDIKKVMDTVVIENSRESYNNTNIKLLEYLFKGNSPLLAGFASQAYINAERLDHAQAKATNVNLRKAMKDSLKYCVSYETCPILLKDMTFEVFAKYLVSRRNIKNGRYLSTTYYEKMRSSLMHLFRTADLIIDEQFYANLSVLMAGMKRTVAREHQASGEDASNTKAPMTLKAYKKMCEILMRSDSPECIFAHAFLTLEWSLMARADNCVRSHMNHLEWRDDALIIYFTHTKGDQEGLLRTEPWHIYSNPLCPPICPILALSKYIFTNPCLLKGDCRIFLGDNQYHRFMKVFRNVLNHHREEFVEIGVNVDVLGSHSARKGAATLCSSGCTVAPPITSICLRAGWSMGNVKMRYLRHEVAGDQFCGRAVTGLNPIKSEFAVSCAYFQLEDGEVLDKYVKDVVCGGAQVSSSMFVLLKMFLATIYCHFTYLSDVLPASHRLRSIPLFISPHDVLLKEAVYRLPWESTLLTPRLTGIPPHVTLLSKMNLLLEKQDAMVDTVIEKIKLELDQRNIGGGYNTIRLMDYFKKTTADIVNRINNLGPTGVSNEMRMDEEERRRFLFQGRQLHTWGGKLQALPQTWKFPRAAFFGAIVIWHMGSSRDKVPALKLLQSGNFSHLKRGGKKFRDLKRLQRYVEMAAKETNTWRPHNDWDEAKLMVMYNAIKCKFNFETRVFGKATRFDQLSWETILDKLKKNNYKFT